jgi:hypothetical protein
VGPVAKAYRAVQQTDPDQSTGLRGVLFRPARTQK